MANNHLNPHDRLFRSLMSDKNVAHEFFAKHLPVDIKKQVQLNSLKLRGNSYIGDDKSAVVVWNISPNNERRTHMP